MQGLYRSTQNRKLAEFLARDFGQEQHRQAAQVRAAFSSGPPAACLLGSQHGGCRVFRWVAHASLQERLASPLLPASLLACLQKNAFVLMGQHRHELAAAFFILGEQGWTACV